MLQDVVFAGGSGKCVDAVSAADRACATKTSDLDAREKQLQKCEMESVRQGAMLTTTERAGVSVRAMLKTTEWEGVAV